MSVHYREPQADSARIKDLQQRAGEIAIRRLIDAHGPEFSRYLAEECKCFGVQPPRRKHLPTRSAYYR